MPKLDTKRGGKHNGLKFKKKWRTSLGFIPWVYKGECTFSPSKFMPGTSYVASHV